MTLDDLKNIDINNIASWPLPIKIGGIAVVGIIVIGLGFWFIIRDELDDLAQRQDQEVKLKERYRSKAALAINLAAYQTQMEEMRQTFGSLLRQLPDTTEVPDLLIDITQAGLGQGLEFVLFKPEKERPKEFYAELPISIKVTGSYHELANFVSDVAALPRIVTFGDITISSDKKSAKLLMSAKAKTYRYLDELEIAELAKANKKKKKGRRKKRKKK
ncbi:MAG: type 4a pilus biogenesis protein PilO [Gammaproteobacteria bacterium]|nr:type 4a pilus biogenesis protein PilO [Pseudomonadota bacterium]MCZ6731481.1 type 4a pilus biogenesis protein PilO [Gammaproteobacteria bacterium]